MANNILVIITDNKVYATYVKTICFKEHYTNEEQKEKAIKQAQSSAFCYALGFVNVYVKQIFLQGSLTDEDIFNYLETY
jgi:ribonucleotide reductase beta subunit family protein with ferritin-like domain